MKLRLIGTVALIVTLAIFTVTVAFGVWSGSQTSSGAVNATSTSADLHICEGIGVTCPGQGDDSGNDELIFEGLEDLIPGKAIAQGLTLTNTGAVAWDVVLAVPSITEVADPGSDCSVLPTLSINIAIDPSGDGLLTGFADDHKPGLVPPGATASIQSLGELQFFDWVVSNSLNPYTQPPSAYIIPTSTAIHVAPSGGETMRIILRLPSDAPPACEDNVWNVTIPWQVNATGF